MDFIKNLDKDAKKLLLLWVISIFISSIAVFSFKDIKFKNTAEIEEKYRQEQLLNQFNDNNTQTDINNESITNDETELNTGWTLTLALLDFFDNDWFYTIGNELTEQWINLEITKIPTFEEFKDMLIKWNLNYDIYLIPSERANWLEWESIYLWENIKPYFNKIFQQSITSTENSFIPYSIDPYITIVKKWIEPISTRWDFFSYIMLWIQNRAFWMPLIRWLWIDDINFLKWWNNSFENQFEILNQQIKQIKEKKNVAELNNMLDIEKLKDSHKYEYSNFRDLFLRLSQNNWYCTTFPASCIMAYNFSDFSFWFLSNFDILDKYFPWKSKNLNIYNFTNSDISYPVRWWIFVVPKWNKNILLVKEFFSKYMSKAMDGEDNLRGNTLSAINIIYETQRLYPLYEAIIPNDNRFIIIRWNINDQESFFNDKKNTELFLGKYNSISYIEN